MNNWQKVKIGDFLFERKGRYKPDDEQIANLPRIEKIDFSGNFHIGNKDSKTDMILIKDGDLVISGINVAKGAMGIYSGEDVTATIHYSSYTFDSNKINVEHFKRFLKSSEFIELLNEQVKGGIKTEIKPKHILPLEIQLPDINTQAQIVQHFENVEDDIANVTQEVLKQQSLLKQLKKTILQEAIEGKLTVKWRAKNPDFGTAKELLEQIKTEKEKLIKDKKIKASKPLAQINEDEIPFDIPSSWEWCKIGDIAYSIVPNRDKPLSFSGEIPWITQTNFNENSFLLDYSKSSLGLTKEETVKYNARIMPQNSVIMSCVGRFDLVVVTEKDIVANQQLHCFVPFYNVVPEYVMYDIKILNFLQIKNAIKTTIQYLNKTKLESILIPLPPIEEQKEIVATIEKLFAITDELESEINQNKTTVNNLMATVLKEAFGHENV